MVIKNPKKIKFLQRQPAVGIFEGSYFVLIFYETFLPGKRRKLILALIIGDISIKNVGIS